jgi:hypothetical protein
MRDTLYEAVGEIPYLNKEEIDAIVRGEPILAVKSYRNRSNCTLAAAADVVYAAVGIIKGLEEAR